MTRGRATMDAMKTKIELNEEDVRDAIAAKFGVKADDVVLETTTRTVGPREDFSVTDVSAVVTVENSLISQAG